LGWYYGLGKLTARALAIALVASTAVIICLSALAEFNFYRVFNQWAKLGWITNKIANAEQYLHNSRATVEPYLMQDRSGMLRPLVALIVLGGLYVLYQAFK